ncbi:MAG TPA: hypothetical protein VEQ16_03085 [Acidocella sp.]|jgi:hypothetical protein|nr:hypothetical protein [Acidocella sp.]
MAKRSLFNPWAFTSMAMQSAMLTFEANQVIAMRLAKLAMGGAYANREAERMVTEKVQAMAEAGRAVTMAALGGKSNLGGDKVVKLYRRKVRANRRRLSR